MSATAVSTIDFQELRRRLEDPDIPESELAPYLELDPVYSGPFSPKVRPKRDVVEVDALEGDVFLSIFNAASRRRRQRRYRRMIRQGHSGPRIVSEGDSWFQYPFLLEDVVDHLFDDGYAIYSLGAAGDLLSDMVSVDEIGPAIAQERPQVLMLSGGGNDMVGGGRLARMVHPFDPGRPARDYPNDRARAFMDELEGTYRGAFRTLLERFPGLRILCHGYDWAIPTAAGKWLGRPLDQQGIRDGDLQAGIVREFIDRFNGTLERLAGEFEGQVFHVDCRGAVGSAAGWHDELHPTSSSFKEAARRFKKAIDAATGDPAEAAGPAGDPGPIAVGSPPHDGGEAGRQKAAQMRFRSIKRRPGRGSGGDGPAAMAAEARLSELEDPERLKLRTEILQPEERAMAQERILGANNLFHVNYFEKGVNAARAVCKVHVFDEFGVPVGAGSGFVVAPGLILTNNHVLDRAGAARRSRVEFLFEYDLNFRPKPTVTFALRPDELFVTNRRLDFTFVAVELVSAGGTGLGDFGSLPLIEGSGKALVGEPVSIVQHPGGGLKQLALRDSKIIGIPEPPEDAFIHYSTDTDRGASGSPVLNDQFQVVALHHSAVPGDAGGWVANEGVRVSRIFDALRGGSGETSGPADQVLSRLLDAGSGPVSGGGGTAVPTGGGGSAGAGAGTQPAEEASTFGPNRWTEHDGYNPRFLGEGQEVPIPMPKDSGDVAATRDGGHELRYTHFSVVMSKSRKLAHVAAVNIHGGRARRIQRGRDRWRLDARLDFDLQTDNAAYKHNDYDRGHLVRRLSPVWGESEAAEKANDDTFHYTNCAPQHKNLNQRSWLDLEDYILETAAAESLRACVFTGPVFSAADRLYRGIVRIPAEYWKVAACLDRHGRVVAAGYLQTQRHLVDDVEEAFGDYKTYRVPVAQIAELTGLDFGALVWADARSSSESAGAASVVRGRESVAFF